MLTLVLTIPASGERRVDVQESSLHGDGLSIGRAPKCNVVLDDPSVSRSHARLLLRDGAVLIEDVGSSSGTLLNGVRLVPRQPTRLSSSDVIAIGACTVKIAEPPKDRASDTATLMAKPPITSYLPLAGVDPASLPRWSDGDIAVRVVKVIDETLDVRTFVFSGEKETLFHYQPGQFMTLNLVIDGKPVKRSYTISSSPSRPHQISITVKRVPGADGQAPGLVSNWLHDHLQVGDHITVSGPYGDFSCAKHASPRLLLISAGSGITPMLSMSRWLTDTGATADTVFLHGARSSKDLIARHELEVLANHNPHLRLIMITSRPEPGSGWLGLTGRLTIELLSLSVPDYASRRIFCCGPGPFMSSVKDMVKNAGFPMDQYHEESFGGAKKSAAPAAAASSAQTGATPSYGLAAILRGINSTSKGADKSSSSSDAGSGSGAQRAAVGGGSSVQRAAVSSGAVLTCTRAKRTVTCEPGVPILEAVEGAGLSWPSGCRMGKCGACKAKVTSGNLDRAGYDDAILSAADKQAGFVLTCIGKPAGAMTVEM